MFSGKTTELIARVEQYPAGSVLAVKHAIDTRFGRDAIISHGGKEIQAIPVRSSREIPVLVHARTQIVAIDEGHFFDVGLIRVIEDLNAHGVNVVLSSLDPDSWGQAFPINDLLLGQAAECVPMKATCKCCGGMADRTQRLTPVIAGNMMVDPSEYEPRCRACWRPPILV